jgi:protein-tyrosine kinase
MDLIERAGRQLGFPTKKSLVEKVADRLEASPAAVSPVPAAADLPRVDVPRRPEEEDANSKRRSRQFLEIDMERLRQMGFAPPGDQSIVAEEIRLIKRPLLTNAFAPSAKRVENANLVMVTSAGPSEGKTFVATNLALSIASEHDVHVLLIDADVAKPSVPRIFDFKAEIGLLDVVEDPSLDLSDVMIRTSIEDLSILPAGRYSTLSNELLASGRMVAFVNDIARRYNDRIVIFDSPPLLARTEPSVLAQHVGQIVFVVQAEKTSRAAINEALSLLDKNKLGGVVLNRTHSLYGSERFGQYYRYYNR